MPTTPENIEDVSPYKLLRNFSKSRLLRCLFLAMLIHAAVIGGLSSDYIYHTWIDPEAAQSEQEAVDDTEDAATPSEDGTNGDSADGAAAPGSDAKDGSSDDTGDAAQNAPVVNRVTEKAEPDQIPDEPGGIGLPIDDVRD